MIVLRIVLALAFAFALGRLVQLARAASLVGGGGGGGRGFDPLSRDVLRVALLVSRVGVAVGVVRLDAVDVLVDARVVVRVVAERRRSWRQ